MAGKREKKLALPLPVRVVRVVLTAVLYAVMLLLVLMFFTGNGTFIYEAF